LLIEHANRTNQQFKLVDTEKPMEETPEVYRFQTPLKAGETKTYTVKEERDVAASVQLTNNADDQIRYFINLKEVSATLKEKLKSALSMKGEWDAARRELQQVQADLQRLNADQDRIRKNLRETPPEAEVYKTYLKKLNDQEKEIDSLTAKQKKLMAEEFEARKKVDSYLANLSDE
jgi:septal ring factor EnvC (AmiA/AmiB activator)